MTDDWSGADIYVTALHRAFPGLTRIETEKLLAEARAGTVDFGETLVLGRGFDRHSPEVKAFLQDTGPWLERLTEALGGDDPRELRWCGRNDPVLGRRCFMYPYVPRNKA